MAEQKVKIIKLSEVFKSVQGEGAFAGYPMFFIRTSGCTRSCQYCDTKYHINGKDVLIKDLIKQIKESKAKIVCWTGGEPLIQREAIMQIIGALKGKVQHHIETNGDLLTWEDCYAFDYIACSPKEEKVAIKVKKIREMDKLIKEKMDIKVVTDLETEGMDMVKYATILMPLTFYKQTKDVEVQRRVWQYCVDNNMRYSARFQFWIWGKRKLV